MDVNRGSFGNNTPNTSWRMDQFVFIFLCSLCLLFSYILRFCLTSDHPGSFCLFYSLPFFKLFSPSSPFYPLSLSLFLSLSLSLTPPSAHTCISLLHAFSGCTIKKKIFIIVFINQALFPDYRYKLSKELFYVKSTPSHAANVSIPFSYEV